MGKGRNRTVKMSDNYIGSYSTTPRSGGSIDVDSAEDIQVNDDNISERSLSSRDGEYFASGIDDDDVDDEDYDSNEIEKEREIEIEPPLFGSHTLLKRKLQDLEVNRAPIQDNDETRPKKKLKVKSKDLQNQKLSTNRNIGDISNSLERDIATKLKLNTPPTKVSKPEQLTSYIPEPSALLTVVRAKIARENQYKLEDKAKNEGKEDGEGEEEPVIIKRRGRGTAFPKFNEPYRQLLNEDIVDARLRRSYDYRSFKPLRASSILGSEWTRDEKDAFFNILPRVGKDNVEAISAAVKTKSIVECSAYLNILQTELNKLLNAPYHPHERLSGKIVSMAEIPAAVELSSKCVNALEAEASRLEAFARKQELKHDREIQTHAVLSANSGYKAELFYKDENYEAVAEISPSANFLKLNTFLTLSEVVFMTGKHSFRQYATFNRYPSIRHQAFIDFHSLVKSITQRIVQASLHQAVSRLNNTRSKEPEPSVRKRDVLAALNVLGLKPTTGNYWCDVVLRCGLIVKSDEKASMGKCRAILTPAEIEDKLKIYQDIEFGINKLPVISDSDSDDSILPLDSSDEASSDDANSYNYTTSYQQQNPQLQGQSHDNVDVSSESEDVDLDDNDFSDISLNDNVNQYENDDRDQVQDQVQTLDSGEDADLANFEDLEEHATSSDEDSDINMDASRRSLHPTNSNTINNSYPSSPTSSSYSSSSSRSRSLTTASLIPHRAVPYTSFEHQTLLTQLEQHLSEDIYIESNDKLNSLKSEKSLWLILGAEPSDILSLQEKINLQSNSLPEKPPVRRRRAEDIVDWRDNLNDDRPIWEQKYYTALWELEGKGRMRRRERKTQVEDDGEGDDGVAEEQVDEDLEDEEEEEEEEEEDEEEE